MFGEETFFDEEILFDEEICVLRTNFFAEVYLQDLILHPNFSFEKINLDDVLHKVMGILQNMELFGTEEYEQAVGYLRFIINFKINYAPNLELIKETGKIPICFYLFVII